MTIVDLLRDFTWGFSFDCLRKEKSSDLSILKNFYPEFDKFKANLLEEMVYYNFLNRFGIKQLDLVKKNVSSLLVEENGNKGYIIKSSKDHLAEIDYCFEFENIPYLVEIKSYQQIQDRVIEKSFIKKAKILSEVLGDKYISKENLVYISLSAKDQWRFFFNKFYYCDIRNYNEFNSTALKYSNLLLHQSFNKVHKDVIDEVNQIQNSRSKFTHKEFRDIRKQFILRGYRLVEDKKRGLLTPYKINLLN